MYRLWIVAGVILFAFIWNFFIRAIVVLVLVLVIGGGIWAWWEIRKLRRATRKTPDR